MFIRGISTNSGVNRIVNNVIRNLNTATGSAGTLTLAANVGIQMTSTSLGTTTAPVATVISNNTIHSLGCSHPTAGVQMSGIYWSGPLGQTSSNPPILVDNQVSRNNIHSLTLASSSASASMIGTYDIGGSATFANNTIRLGLDSTGTGLGSGISVTGLWKATSSRSSFFHNSIYLGGSGVVGATNTFAFRRQFSSSAIAIDSVFNNIFVNARSADFTATGKHYAGAYDVSNFLVANSNLYGATGTNGVLLVNPVSALEYTTLDSWRSLTGLEAQSGTGAPNFRNATGGAATVDLRVQGTTAAEGAGTAISWITTDAEGDVRSSLTPTDIGADAGNYTYGNDQQPPLVVYTPLPNALNTSARTLTASITDRSGVPTSGSGLPVLYWRINSAATWSSAQGTSAGSGNYTFTFGAGVVPNDTVRYYIVAQDAASTPNVTVAPLLGMGGLTANPPTAATAPTTPSQYLVGGAICGTRTVGTGGDFPTLRAAFDAINNGQVTCDVILSVISNTTETASCVLNAVNYGSGGPYRIIIRPAAGTVDTIGGNVAGPLVNLAGASRVIIDGRQGGTGTPKSLVFDNTSTNGVINTSTNSYFPCAVRIYNGASNDTLRHAVFRSSAQTGGTNIGVITVDTVYAGGSIGRTTAGNNNLVISNNDVRESSNGSWPGCGILVGTAATGTVTPSLYNNNGVISNNNVFNICAPAGFNSIFINVTNWNSNWTVSGNSVYNTAPPIVLPSNNMSAHGELAGYCTPVKILPVLAELWTMFEILLPVNVICPGGAVKMFIPTSVTAVVRSVDTKALPPHCGAEPPAKLLLTTKFPWLCVETTCNMKKVVGYARGAVLYTLLPLTVQFEFQL
ncbi:MAG: hypothetical protein ACKOAG_01335, partial [Candidatus Kapaibacterium sp.]